jgi:hypothetical protein
MTHPRTADACRAKRASVYRIAKKKHTTILHLKDGNVVIGLGGSQKPMDDDATSHKRAVIPARLDLKLWYSEWWSRQYIG